MFCSQSYGKLGYLFFRNGLVTSKKISGHLFYMCVVKWVELNNAYTVYFKPHSVVWKPLASVLCTYS
jgi:hypothetical protein